MNDQALTKKQQGIEIRDLLEGKKEEIQKAAGAILDANTLIRITCNVIQKNPLIAKCTPASILFAVMDSASYGLVPNSLTNEGHLIPFWNNKAKYYEAVFMPGYKGLITLAMNTGMIDGVEVREVNENDFFEFAYGLSPKLDHIPAPDDPGDFIGAYAIVRMKEGLPSFGYLSKEQALIHADKFSKAKDKNGNLIKGWKDDVPAMTMKTILKKTLKYCPASQKSEKLNKAIAMDDINEGSGSYAIDAKPDIPMPQEKASPDKAAEVEAQEVGETVDQETGEIVDAEIVSDQSEKKESAEPEKDNSPVPNSFIKKAQERAKQEEEKEKKRASKKKTNTKSDKDMGL